MMKNTWSSFVGAAAVAGLIAVQSACSTAPSQEAACAAARDEQNAAVDARFNAISQAIKWSWAPDIGARPGALRTLQVSIQTYQVGRAWQYELNDLAYKDCLGRVS